VLVFDEARACQKAPFALSINIGRFRPSGYDTNLERPPPTTSVTACVKVPRDGFFTSPI
jgi:hypothetical protein